jgi:cell division protein FtsB
MHLVRRFFSVRKLWLPATLLLYMLLVSSTVVGNRGVLHLQSLSAEQDTLEAQVFILLRENETLRECIARLKTDDSFLERVVREELGFVRPGEIVYRFQSTTSASPHWERTCMYASPR